MRAWIDDMHLSIEEQGLEGVVAELAGTKTLRVSSDHLNMFWSHQRWSLQVPFCSSMICAPA